MNFPENYHFQIINLELDSDVTMHTENSVATDEKRIQELEQQLLLSKQRIQELEKQLLVQKLKIHLTEKKNYQILIKKLQIERENDKLKSVVFQSKLTIRSHSSKIKNLEKKLEDKQKDSSELQDHGNVKAQQSYQLEEQELEEQYEQWERQARQRGEIDQQRYDRLKKDRRNRNLCSNTLQLYFKQVRNNKSPTHRFIEEIIRSNELDYSGASFLEELNKMFPKERNYISFEAVEQLCKSQQSLGEVFRISLQRFFRQEIQHLSIKFGRTTPAIRNMQIQQGKIILRKLFP